MNFRDSHRPFPTDGAPFGQAPPPHPREGLRCPLLSWTPAVRAEMARYYDGLRRMDATAGAMLDRIEARAPDDELVGLFTSDNGPPFPFAKTTLYEAGTHMPLIAFGAGVVRGRRDELAGLVDVLPTLLELAGGPVDGFDGRSLVPALEGRALGSGEVPWRDQIATTRTATGSSRRSRAGGALREVEVHPHLGGGLAENNAMRTSDTWRAMIAAAERDAQVLQRIQRYVERPSEELYDLEADPEELHDLSRDAAMSKILEEGGADWRTRRSWTPHEGGTGSASGDCFARVLRCGGAWTLLAPPQGRSASSRAGDPGSAGAPAPS